MSSALIRPGASSAGTVVQGAKNAVRGSTTGSGARVQLTAVAAGRGGPDPAAMAWPSVAVSRPIVTGVSAIVTVATMVSRSAISSSMSAACARVSTEVPSAPVPARLSTSSAGMSASVTSPRSVSSARARRLCPGTQNGVSPRPVASTNAASSGASPVSGTAPSAVT